ncbi:MAG TPA: shikimate dehydrogenase [Alphaproteobacteria bacterium]|nr:shikimate dehydrogenase [Alphaproteobacteria bacterium]
MKTFGLIGKNLSHSFSSSYFNEKFFKERITNTEYLNFELNDISEFPQLIKKQNLSGINVTLPYKESIIPFLDELSENAKRIGSVNTIQISRGRIIGHNTDVIGFKKSITPLLAGRNTALILGDGGAAKAVKFIFNQLNISHKTINRNSAFDYSDITSEIIDFNTIIVNATPLGMIPEIKNYPQIPYELLTEKHLLFDLIYNPKETLFLKYGRVNKACTKNGLEMLQIQAETSWSIWNT